MAGVYNGHPVTRPPRTDHYAHNQGDVHYHNMNLHSWFFRGTVECRMHTGTIVAHKIVDWAITWQAIMDRALSITPEEIAAIKDPVEELLRVSPTEHSRTYIKTRLAAYRADYKTRGYPK
jgi:Putative amidoligase enzyme